MTSDDRDPLHESLDGVDAFLEEDLAALVDGLTTTWGTPDGDALALEPPAWPEVEALSAAAASAAEVVADIDSDARPTDAPAPPVDTERPSVDPVVTARYLVCSIAGRRCALPLANVSEVGRVPAAVPLPFVPGWIAGVISLRGHIVSLVDLATLLSGRPSEAPARMVVIKARDGDIFAASLVDAVHGIRDVDVTTIGPPDDTMAAFFGGYVSGKWHDADDAGEPDRIGVAARPVPILDVEQIVASERAQVRELA
jgi:chemotaxis signal transduction protein